MALLNKMKSEIRKNLGRMRRLVSRVRKKLVLKPVGTEVDTAVEPRGSDEHIYNVLWSIPRTFGGMTRSVLRRANSFVEYGSPRSVSILTLTHTMNVEVDHKRLVAEGFLQPDIRLRNFWVDVRRMDNDQLRKIFHGKFSSQDAPQIFGEPTVETRVYRSYVNELDPKYFRREHIREDGTLLLLDTRSKDQARRLILHDTSGNPICEWHEVRNLYAPWINWVVERPGTVIVDQATSTTIALALPSPELRLVHFLHVSHLANPGGGKFGEIVPSRRQAFQEFDHFSFFAIQTQEQIEDLVALGFDRSRLKLLPSSLEQEAYTYDPNLVRSESSGIIVSRLVELKQLDQGLEAVKIAIANGAKLTLDVCGDGEERSNLEARSSRLGLSSVVSFHGHVNDTRKRLAEASFSILTSQHEGLGLSIIESMAAGCVPIVYEFSYGPQDLITHGVNGYLVPQGDIEALASQIEEFIALPLDQKERMRGEAAKRAQWYSTKESYDRWARALEQPATLESPTSFLDSTYYRHSGISVVLEPDNLRISLAVDPQDPLIDESILIVFESRDKKFFFESLQLPRNSTKAIYRNEVSFLVPLQSFEGSDKKILNVFLRKPGTSWSSKVRLRNPSDFDSIQINSMEWFSTEYRNLSIRFE